MAEYSEAFKQEMVARMARPGGPSACQLSREVGVPQSTLSRWLRRAGRSKAGGSSEPRAPRRPQEWSAAERLELVIESAGLSEEELGALLRRRGVHSSQLEDWRRAALEGVAGTAAARRRRSPEARRIHQLEQELRRKDKALAETAALLVLRKKVERLWGDEGAGTPRRRDK